MYICVFDNLSQMMWIPRADSITAQKTDFPFVLSIYRIGVVWYLLNAAVKIKH